MNIDKEKLKLGIWYEDENGNVINQKEDLMCKAPEKPYEPDYTKLPETWEEYFKFCTEK